MRGASSRKISPHLRSHPANKDEVAEIAVTTQFQKNKYFLKEPDFFHVMDGEQFGVTRN